MIIAGKEIKFKLEFGNPTHIKIAQILGRIEKNHKLLQKKIEEKGGIEPLKKIIKDDKIEVIKLIRYANKMLKP